MWRYEATNFPRVGERKRPESWIPALYHELVAGVRFELTTFGL
jgi:hypothetical protein